jgi:general secretion pathway protein D
MFKIPGMKNSSERNSFFIPFILALCLLSILTLFPALPSPAETDTETAGAEETITVDEDAEKEAVQESSKKKKEKKVTVNFVDVEIPVVVKFISEITGKNFVFDDKVKGTISIMAPSKLTVDEAFSLFTSVLELKGFTIIQSGKVYKIVPITQAKQSGTEIMKDSGEFVTDAYITRLIPLESISSTTAMNFLQPLISRDGHISSFGPSNMLMIVDSASNIEKIMQIIEAIDKPGVEEPELIVLKYASAEDVAMVITEALSIRDKPATTRARVPRVGEAGTAASVDEERSYVFADPRLNAVILIADKQEREAMKRMIALLDIPLPEATSKINVYFLENADAEELSKVLQKMISGISQARVQQASAKTSRGPLDLGGQITISPDAATNSLVIVASPADYQSLEQVIRQLDKKRKQVYVEAMIVEASIENLKEIGTQWRITAEKDNEPVFITGVGQINQEAFQNILTGLTGLSAGGVGNFLDVPVSTVNSDGTVTTSTLTIPGFSALFNLEEFRGAVNVLSTPQILTSDNREAEIIVGENVPFITKSEANAAQPDSIFNTIERTDVGITLRITPQITEGDFVRLDIYQEISALIRESLEFAETIGPTTTKRSTKTSVVVKDRETVVISGLMQEREEENITKVPLLGDIPLLGYLFKSKSARKEKTNLLVFLTPHIIKDAGQLEELTDQKTLKFSKAENRYRQGELLVQFMQGVTEERIQEILSREDASAIAVLNERGLYHIRLEEGQDVEDAVEDFMEYEEVEHAEPNYLKKIQ